MVKNSLLGKPKPKLRKYPDDFINKVIQGDCLEVMKDIPNNSIDLVVTDPPYGIDYSAFRSGKGNLINDDNLEWTKDFFCLLKNKVKKNSHLYCFCDPEMIPDFIFEIRKYWKIRNILTIPRAIKGNGGDRIFQQQFEFCIFATYGDGRKFNKTKILETSNGYRKDKRYGAKKWCYRLPDNWFWTIASTHNLKRNHPTEKNWKCIKYMLLLSSNENDIILDPFLGSGTTSVVCKKLNRRFIGIEISPEYCNISRKRINNVPKRLDKFDLKTKIGE